MPEATCRSSKKIVLVREVEQRILGEPDSNLVYSRSFNVASGQNMSEDVIGVVQLEFIDWDKRRPAAENPRSPAPENG